VGRDVRCQRGLLRHRQLARPVTAPRAGAHLTGAATSDQRLVDVRHTDPKQPRRRTRGHAAVNRRQHPRPQILRIALSPPPRHRRPQHLATKDSESHFLWFRNPSQRFQPMRLCSSQARIGDDPLAQIGLERLKPPWPFARAIGGWLQAPFDVVCAPSCDQCQPGVRSLRRPVPADEDPRS